MRYIPVVQDNKSSSDLYSRLLKDRIVLLYGEINDDIAELVTAQLLYLESEDPTSDITIYINSPGGHIHSGLSILDTMNLVSCDIRTVCLGHAASMGAVLLAGGTKGKRCITPNGEVMIHQPLGGVNGQETDIRIGYEHILRSRKRLEQYLSEWTKQPLSKIHEDCDRDYWMSAEEAMEYGIVDKIFTQEGDNK